MKKQLKTRNINKDFYCNCEVTSKELKDLLIKLINDIVPEDLMLLEEFYFSIERNKTNALPNSYFNLSYKNLETDFEYAERTNNERINKEKEIIKVLKKAKDLGLKLVQDNE